MRTLLALISLAIGFNTYAQEESTTKAKKEEIMREQRQNAPVQEDIDNEITNAKMRADNGSKSKHSLSMAIGYSGGTVDDAFGRTRPDLIGGSPVDPTTSLGGDINYRYRLSQRDSLSLGVGIAWRSPGYDLDKTRQDKGISQYEASSPSVGYTRSFKAKGIQNVVNVSYSKNTSNFLLKNYAQNQDVGAAYTGLMEIGTSGWQLGLAVEAIYHNYYTFLVGRQAEYDIGVFPFAEYAFNDKYNFRTVYRGNSYTSMREDSMAFGQSEITQSAGVGIAATRDLFFYPNLQWDWRDTRADKTNVAVSASLNFF